MKNTLAKGCIAFLILVCIWLAGAILSFGLVAGIVWVVVKVLRIMNVL
jgi:hypothetical protein